MNTAKTWMIYYNYFGTGNLLDIHGDFLFSVVILGIVDFKTQ